MLLIFTTEKDYSVKTVITSCRRKKIPIKVIDFAKLSIKDNSFLLDNKRMIVNKNDRILLRWPWNASDLAKDYNVYVRKILIDHPLQIVFDRKCLLEFSPFYEDKLFQSFIFNTIGVSTPATFHYQVIPKNNIKFPLVLKKRLSSRSKHNFLVLSSNDIKKKLGPLALRDFILQEKIEIVKDIRVIVLKGKFIGAASRKTHVREENRLAVKGWEAYKLTNQQIVKDALKVAKYLGADFVGFDVLIDNNEDYFFIEANLSPQFTRFEEVTGIPLSEKIVDLCFLSHP